MEGSAERAGGAVDDPTSLDRLAAALRGVPVEGAALPDECVRELMLLLGAERFCALRPLPGPGGCSLELMVFRGFPCGIDTRQQTIQAFETCAGLGPPAFDFTEPTAPAARPGQVVRPLAELPPESSDRARALMRQLGAGGYDVLRVVVCDGPRFLAWVGVLRRSAFTEHERLAFEQVVPLLSDHLALAERLRHAALFEAGLGTALEALAEPAFLLRRDGTLVQANRAAGELGLSTAELREQLGRALSGEAGEWSAQPVGSGVEPQGYLVTRRCSGQRARPVAMAAQRWELTRAERRVLARLAEGCSNKQIAQTLCCSARTVEIHVSAILRKSRCDSRAAVVAELGGMGGSA